MRIRFHLESVLLLAAFSACGTLGAQANAKPAASQQGESLDRIVAVVNGEILLESDIQEEMRYAALQPYRTASGNTPREQALNRLVDRALILQQQQGYAQVQVTDAQIDEEEKGMRTDLPACKRFDCDTEEGWAKFLVNHAFTEKELRERLKTRIQVLHFIQQRFRAGIRISDEQIEEFYTKTMLPQYAREHVAPPPLDTVSDRIEQVLLQQQVSELLDQWLKTLHEQGTVRILNPGEEAP